MRNMIVKYLLEVTLFLIDTWVCIHKVLLALLRLCTKQCKIVKYLLKLSTLYIGLL